MKAASQTTMPNPTEPASPTNVRQEIPAWILALCGMLALYGPSFWDLLNGGVWSNDQQGHGPIVLGISVWLLWRHWPDILILPAQPRPAAGWTMMVISLLLYTIGRSQDILMFEIGSLILTLSAVLLLYRGHQAIRLVWFALFFMLFMVPLPGQLVDAMTQPLKMAVSYAAENILYTAGYPISRTGVMLHIGQYQLLVADACAGLHTLFTLEALGLLYLNLFRHESAARNITLAILIVPISFTANVIRVMTLTLITYYFGDEAGQGFLHGFAGMVLFMAALLLITTTDSLLRTIIGRQQKTINSATPAPASKA
jgi:exosortase B